MFGIPSNYLAGGGIALAAVLYHLWETGGLKFPSLFVAKPLDRKKAVDCVDYLIAYFKDCPEGLSAAEQCGQHLFHNHPASQ